MAAETKPRPVPLKRRTPSVTPSYLSALGFRHPALQCLLVLAALGLAGACGSPASKRTAPPKR
ncbi:MAG: hypothetical protein ACR2P8_10235, partial [Myxococcota bacterium]